MKRSIYLIILIIFLAAQISAQDYSTSVGRFLLLGGGARANALGGAYTAVGEDATTITWNPGGLGSVKSFEISFMHMSYRDDLSYLYAASTIPLDFGTFGLNLIYFGMDPLAERSGGDDIPGSKINYYDMAVSFSFGKEFMNMLGFGFNAKYIKNGMGIEEDDYYSASGFAFDFGVLAKFELLKFYSSAEKNFRVGAVVQNIGTGLKYIEDTHSFPMVIRPGLFYKPIRYAEVMLDYNLINDSSDTINAGLEIMPEWILSPRGGIKISDELTTYTFGAGLKYNVGSFLLQFDYAYNMDSESYFNRHILSLALRKFSSSLAAFGIGDIVISDVFPAMYKYYTKNPVTKVEIKNNTNIPIEKIKVTMFVNKNMDFPSESKEISSLSPGREVTVELPAEFNNEVLKITEETPMQAQIKVNYIAEGKRQQLTSTKSFKMYNRYAMTWDNFNKLAAFVTPKDTPVRTFARGIVQRYSKQRIIKDMPFTVIQAAVIFDALGSLGLTYVLDPQSPFRKKGDTVEIVDQIQYPRDTLRFKTGDCDDCSVLFCTLLETIGLNTAFVDVKDHIFMMFDTQVPEDEAFVKFGSGDLYIIQNGTVWLPIETTMFSKGFSAAWSYAAKTYNEALSKGIVTIIDVKKAWKDFYSVTLPDTQWESPFPSKIKMNKFMSKDQKMMRSLGSAKLINEIKAQLKRNPRSVDLLNRLGVLYGKAGKTEASKKYLNSAIKIKPGTSKYYNNLANTYFLENNLEAALKNYKKAIKLEPDNPNYRINISNLYNIMGNTGKAEAEIAKAEELISGQ